MLKNIFILSIVCTSILTIEASQYNMNNAPKYKNNVPLAPINTESAKKYKPKGRKYQSTNVHGQLASKKKFNFPNGTTRE